MNLKKVTDIKQEYISLLLDVCGDDKVEQILVDYIETGNLFEVYDQQSLVGLIGVEITKTIDVIKHIVVQPDLRRKGYGKKIIQSWAQQSQAQMIEIEMDKDSVLFYDKIGFRIVSLGEKYPSVVRYRGLLNLSADEESFDREYFKTFQPAIKFEKLGIIFSGQYETPYFQVTDSNRIRFGHEKLTAKAVAKLICYLFEGTEIDCYMLKETRRKQKNRLRSNLKRFFKITNWKEIDEPNFVFETEDFDFQYVAIKNLELSGLIKYCQRAYQGYQNDEIIFYNNEYIMYINCDVIDIISSDINIKILKTDYKDIYNRYYEVS